MRKVDRLNEEVYQLWVEFDKKMKEAGIRYEVTCAVRTQAEQDSLYAQGRTKPGPIVTKVKHSKHQDGIAFDIVIVDSTGRAVWIPSAYREAGKIGQSVGLRWGGDWDSDGSSEDEKFLDYPHFEQA
jgi:peptidoglycan L-alanyl-D-glutamate endopeptidase CwlK